jgi:hypothetical protein
MHFYHPASRTLRDVRRQQVFLWNRDSDGDQKAIFSGDIT